MSPVLLLGLLAAAVPSVAVTGDCPGAEAVTAALRSALGSDAKVGVSEPPRVSDQGDRFSVAAAGQVQQYADPGRDCEERARAAAVFIALALNPPLAPPGPAPTVRDAPAPPPPPASARWLDLAVAARADGGPGQAVGPAIGAEIHAAAGWRWLGVAATAGILAPSEGTYSSITVRQQRFPLSLALTARRDVSQRLAIAGAAGAALVPLTVRATAIDGGPSSTRLDAGIRLAFELRFRATPRLAPFVDLHAEFFPRAYELQVDPLGTIGSTGRFWLGVSAGVAFEAL
ncbi:MAG TPA: hypothetical protein VIQ54_27115 [Polyangia bacterium]